MSSMWEFFAMEGYAAYVWPSFAAAAAIMLVMTAASLQSLRKAERALKQLQESAARRQ